MNELFLTAFQANEAEIVFGMEDGTQGRHTIFHSTGNLQIVVIWV